ncbi:hypothetical protein UFOVP1290_203 [uncultured Caudovirales phage]|uniref:Uncharacterized protein n=1 Tax=uncultured Caudovirales phage TaxID=2100421 RepID=A0A6J5RH47_9CAUD|nr:hypothetical protein UFOVP1290_203 [uncultured Caudovirales phage]
MEHWKFECQNWNLGEAASLLRADYLPFELASKESKIQMAEWLEELDQARKAMHDARLEFERIDQKYRSYK